MDFLRISGPLLRSSQPLLPFLAPSASNQTRRVALTSSRRFRRKPSQLHPSRSFTTSHTQSQAEASTTTTTTTNANQRTPPTPPPKSSAAEEFTAILDSALDGDKGVPTAPMGRTSRFTRSGAQVQNSQSRVLAERQRTRYNDPATSGSRGEGEEDGGGGAIAELFKEVAKPRHMPNNRQGAGSVGGVPSRQVPGGGAIGSDSFMDISQMLDPLSNTTNPHTPNSLTSSRPPPIAPLQTPPMKLNSSVGRTIQVQEKDVARAFRTLEITCARNSVRRDFMRQRFHERPGLKRKRLKSERWRRRFKEAFRGTIGMVQRMRGQGW